MKILRINVEYNIGEIVYLKTDTEQRERMVSSIKVFNDGNILYYLCCGTNETTHFEIEISAKKNILKTLL